MKMFQEKIQNNDYKIRKETYDGIEHIVVPVVMMTAGVRPGSDGPILHTEEELEHITAAWNGIPVVVNHPQNEDGAYISANSPSVPYVGRIFNAHYDNGLKAEAWINPTQLNVLSPAAMKHIKNQNPLEVSVGVFTDTDFTPGEISGNKYIGVAHNYRPDHLALLPGGTGACSWEDGCGIRVNSFQGNGGKGSGNFGHSGRPGERGGSGDGGSNTVNDAMTKSFIDSGMDEDAAQDLSFGIAKLQKKGKIDDADVAYITKLVKKGKYDLATKLISTEFTNSIKTNTMNKHDFLPMVVNSLNDRKNEYLEIVEKARNKVYGMDNPMAYHYVIEVYDDGLIYSTRNKETGKETFYKQSFMIDSETGEMEFTDEPIKVKREISFIANENKPKTIETNKKQKGDQKMNKTKCAMVSALIANAATQFSEEHREFLMGLEVDQLELFEPIPQRNTVNDEIVAAYLKDKSADAIIPILPAELQANLKEMNDARTAKRKQMIDGILAVNKEFTEQELSAMPCSMLSKISAMSGTEIPADYSGRPAGGAPVQANAQQANEDEPLMSV